MKEKKKNDRTTTFNTTPWFDLFFAFVCMLVCICVLHVPACLELYTCGIKKKKKRQKKT